MSDDLEDLIEQARYRVVNGLISDEEWRENTISFAYGNGHIEDERVTREGVARAYDASRRDPKVSDIETGQAALQERARESVAHGKESQRPNQGGRPPS